MRVIVMGVGAVGGVVAAALARSGTEVIGIARGAMLRAIRDQGGLHLRSPEVDERVPLTCVETPDQIAFRPDDAILMTMKTQDSLPALQALRRAGVRDQPIFCLQNGVANEGMALRLFPHVHGVTVMMPATYLTPGECVTHCLPQFGMFDLGRYPAGHDAADSALAAALEAANFAPFVKPRVMESKYGKLLVSLGNICGAAFGEEAGVAALRQALADEGKAVLAAAGIGWEDVGSADPRRAIHTRFQPVDGVGGMASSTLQSLLRGGSVETDYLNGEISLLGRMHAIPTPLNDAMVALATRMTVEGIAPGSLDPADTLAALGLG